MQVLRFDLKPSQDNYVELRYFFTNQIQYEERYLNLAEITHLIQEAERDYYTPLPENHEVTGKRLFNWLDGDKRWLSRAIQECRGEELVVAIKAEQQLTHLPWEVLHDDDDFLINRVNPVVVPVRWIEGNGSSKELEARPLRVLFMATSPLNVKPVLDFEQEEATILQETETADSPLKLRVEESGSTSGLQKVWSRYTDTFDVFHLSGHASINDENAVPYFITETETGERCDTTAEELAKVLQFRFPKLVFLSGCRTGESIKNGTLPSLAEALINQGATAVLGWGRPVTDTGATVAAAKLYSKLANGYSLPQALAVTYRFLLELNIRDWHLLRLYVQGECPGALVNPLEDEVWIPEEPVYEQFLDPVTQQVRVATPDQFVGRRRTLQRCLKQLGISKNLGVLIHGMGGVGKSSVTARLLERMTGYDRIVIYRGLDELKLLNRLSEQCTSETGHEILNGKLPLMQRLTKFLQAGLNRKEQRFTFVLDDFEANLELRVGCVLKPEVVSVLTDLLKAIQKSRLPHRVIITSRYDFKLPQLDRNIYREPLAALRNADLIKKYNRLESFNGTVDIDPELQLRAKKAADGNPRLLEWLDKILGDGIADVDIILEKIETTEKEFRENILAEELLKQQDADLKKLLGKALVYELPVPKVAISPICQDISNLDSHIQRGTSLGLLEVNLTISRDSSREELYRVSRILEPLLEPENKESLSGEAAKVLYQLWWESGETSTEEQKLEIHRLALLGEETKIAGNLASNLANSWKNQSRFREAVKLCELTLDITQDYRVLHQLARSEAGLGYVELANQHNQQALELCPQEDEREKASIIHNLAIIYATQGYVNKAILLEQESLELYEKLGDVKGKIASLEFFRVINVFQNNLDEAIAFWEQSLELEETIGNVQEKYAYLQQFKDIWLQKDIEYKDKDILLDKAIDFHEKLLQSKENSGDLQGQATFLQSIAIMHHALQNNVDKTIAFVKNSLELSENIGDIQGKATSLHYLAIIHEQQGNLDEAVAFYQQSLELYEKIDNIRGKAASLHQIATIFTKRGDVDKAIDLYQQSLEFKQKIDDLEGKAKSLAMLGQLMAAKKQDFSIALDYLQQSLEIFEHLKSNDAEQAKKWIFQVKLEQLLKQSPEAQQLYQQLESADEDARSEIISRLAELLMNEFDNA